MKKFKDVPLCKKHGLTYLWKEGGCRICKEERKPRKTIGEVLEDMKKKYDKNSDNNI